MRRNISNVLCVNGAPLFGSTLAPRRSIAFRNSAGTWSRVPGKQFGVLGRWRDRHTRRWSDTLRIRPVRWRKWNRIRIDLARLADPMNSDVVMDAMAFQITVVSIVRSTVCSKKTFKLRATGLFEGNPPVNGGFPSQRASNAENVSIRWRHHAYASKGRNEFAKRSMQRYDVNLSLKIGC